MLQHEWGMTNVPLKLGWPPLKFDIGHTWHAPMHGESVSRATITLQPSKTCSFHMALHRQVGNTPNTSSRDLLRCQAGVHGGAKLRGPCQKPVVCPQATYDQ